MNSNNEANTGISSQAAVEAVGNRYDLILIGARRVRELTRGDRPRVQTRRGKVVTALAEIEAGLVGRDYLLRSTHVERKK